MSVILIALLGALGPTALPVSPQISQPVCPAGGSDADGDGLSDTCEMDLLTRFAPVLVASPAACNWDESSGRLRGGYLIGAHPVAGAVLLAYLPAYRRDCGWSGPKCLLRPFGGCDPHAGDSEAIFVELVEGEGGWGPRRVFLSAHCFGHLDGRCRWYRAEALEWEGAAPIIWVAEGKNANYPSRENCDSGHLSFDTCDRNGRRFSFPVVSMDQNMGSPSHPFPSHEVAPACVEAPELPWGWEPAGMECIWTARRFFGWSGAGSSGSTGYRKYLELVGGGG